jgi:four helix bundle protein
MSDEKRETRGAAGSARKASLRRERLMEAECQTTEPIRDFRQLVLWQRSMDLALAVYKTTGAYPREELYGLVVQMRRAAVSVCSNVAEGYARRSTREFLQFLSIADGSLAELQTQLILGTRLGYSDVRSIEHAMSLLEECQKMLHAIQARLRERLKLGLSRGWN